MKKEATEEKKVSATRNKILISRIYKKTLKHTHRQKT